MPRQVRSVGDGPGPHRPPARRPGRHDGVGEVGARPRPGAARPVGGDRVGRLDAGLPGDGHRHGQTDPCRPGRGTAPPDRHRRPVGRVHGGVVRGRGPASGRRHRLPGAAGAAGRRHRAVPAGGGRRPAGARPVPRGACRPRRRARHLRPLRPPGDARPHGRRAHGADEPAAGRPGPRGDARQRPAVLLLRARARRPTRRAGSTWWACGCRTPSWPTASPPATSGRWPAASWPRSNASLADPRGLSRTAGQALGYRELAAHVTEGVPLDEALDLAVRRTRRFARRQASWFRRDPRIRWLDSIADPSTLRDALEREVAAADDAGETGTHASRRRAD